MAMKRAFLWSMVVSLSLAALVGVAAILFEDFFNLAEGKIFGTLMTVSFFSLTALGASIVLERNRWRLGMIAGLTISGTGLVFYLAVIWGEDFWYSYSVYNDWIWKIMWALGVWAVALPHAGLLSLAQLSKGVWRWVQFLSITAVLLFAGLLTAMVVLEFDEEVAIRCLGVLGILTALGTIGVPLLTKLHRIEKLDRVESTALALKLTCPRCLLEQVITNGHARCRQCRLKFHIEIEEPRCPGCNYLLHQLVSPQCPECGLALSQEEVVAADAAATREA